MSKSDGDQCIFPPWLSFHHDWRSIGDQASIHVNKKGHSIKMRNRTSSSSETETHATCHQTEEIDQGVTRVVAHVKSGW